MPEQTETLKAENEVVAEDKANDSGTESESDESIPELEETGTGTAAGGATGAAAPCAPPPPPPRRRRRDSETRRHQRRTSMCPRWAAA